MKPENTTAEKRPRGSWLLGDDLTGRTSGELVVIGRTERPENASKKIKGTWWLCRCACGNTKVLPRCSIVNEHTKSCGCMKPGKKAATMSMMIAKPPKKVRREKAPEDIKLASSCEGLATECECPICGRTFERLSKEWAYKITINNRLCWLCSWKCLSKIKYKKQGLRVAEV